MRLKNFDLMLALFIAVLNIGWALLPNRPLLGVILVLPLVFIVPGYTLTTVLSYKQSSGGSANHLLLEPTLILGRPFDTADRLILSLGLSMAIDILSGFILNMMPIGLQALSWAVFLGILTAIFALLSAYLRRGMQGRRRETRRFRIALHECMLLVLAVVILVLSFQYAVTSAAQQPRPGFTQLWMIQSNSTKTPCTVRLGVHSFELTSKTYSATMTVNSDLVLTWSAITLAPQQEWDQQVQLTPGINEKMDVEVQLFMLDKPGVTYREVHLTLHSLKRNSSDRELQCTT